MVSYLLFLFNGRY